MLFSIRTRSSTTRVDAVLKDVQDGKGTLPKLLKDDDIYNDLKTASADTKKLVKNSLAARTWQGILSGLCALLERTFPWPPLLHRLYRVMLAVAIYQGFQEGLKIHNIDYEECK